MFTGCSEKISSSMNLNLTMVVVSEFEMQLQNNIQKGKM